MANIIAVLVKVAKWVPLNIVSVLGVVQAIIKFAKEVVTAVVNLLLALVVLLPGVDFKKANAVVEAVRGWIEKLDGWVEKGKGYILKWVHA